MSDHLTLTGDIAARQRRQTIIAIREDAIATARQSLMEGYADTALATLIIAAERTTRLEEQR